METMTLDDLKRVLEERTAYRFERSGEDLYMKNLAKRTQIQLSLGRYSEKHPQRVSIDCEDARHGRYNGFSYAQASLDELVIALDRYAIRYGWVRPEPEQLSWFEEGLI